MNKLATCENITKKILYSLFEIVDQNKFSSLKGKILINAFFEPSTRTSLSFESAMKRMDGEVINYYDSYSSSKKGETFEDTIRTLCAYGDILVLRHPKKEFLANSLKISSIPIINAGNGDGEHPTQAILDLYTIYNHFNKKAQPFDLQKLRVLFIGDIKHSRTIHSLLTLLHLFPQFSISMLPYYNLEPSAECVRQIKENHSQDAVIVERQNIIWKDYDVVYCTRRQKERSDTEINPLDKKDDFILTNDIANQMHNDAIILHPLPRNDELATDVDLNHRAKYFEQAKHGVKIRQALIQMILNNA